MTIKELSNLSKTQIQDVLSLMNELTSNVVVSQEILIKAAGSKTSHFFAVLDHTEHIVGCATLCVFNSPTGTKASLEDVVVSSKYRRQGLGKLLVQHVIEYAKAELHTVDIHLTSNPQRVAANNLYRKMGFEKQETNAYTMKIRVSE